MSNPLAELLNTYGYSNHDVVEAAAGQLSHKNVQKARTGSRPVTDGVARNITVAVQNLLAQGVPSPDGDGSLVVPAKFPTVRELFLNYPRGRARGSANTEAAAEGTEADEADED
ncbi:MAG: hypothetical protein RL318_1827 [Fibrobacterota bacterium]|jgi:hypothetical protein